MAVDDVMRTFGGPGARGFGDDDGMAGGGAKPRAQADFVAMAQEPGGARSHVLAMLRLGGDAGEADILNQLPDETGLIIPQITNYFFHVHDTEAGGDAGLFRRPGRGHVKWINGLNDGLCIFADLGGQLRLMTLSVGNTTWRVV